MLLLVLRKSSQVLGEVWLTDLVIESEQDLVQYLDLFFDSLVGPQPRQMEPLHKHECSDLTVRFLLQDHMLDNILFEMWMLEDLVLHLSEKEKE